MTSCIFVFEKVSVLEDVHGRPSRLFTSYATENPFVEANISVYCDAIALKSRATRRMSIHFAQRYRNRLHNRARGYRKWY